RGAPPALPNSTKVVPPSAKPPPPTTARRLRSPVRTRQVCRQQATANSPSFRSLALPRRNSSIFCGSGQASHSCSVMASLLPQDQVHGPRIPAPVMVSFLQRLRPLLEQPLSHSWRSQADFTPQRSRDGNRLRGHVRQAGTCDETPSASSSEYR